MTKNQTVVSDDYRAPVMFALALQIPIALICLCVLDGGHLAKVCGIAMAAHWTGILLAMHRRPLAPTVMDLLYVRAGFLMIFAPLVALLALP